MMWKCVIALLLFVLISLGFYAIGSNTNNESVSKNTPSNIIHNNTSFKLNKKRINQHVPKFMLDLYHQNVNDSFFNGPDIVRSVIPKTAGFISDSNNKYFEDKHLLYFDIPSSNKDEEFLSAELKILTIVENAHLSDIERFIKISIFDDSENNLLYLEKLYLQHTNNSWLTFNLTSPVQVLLQKDTKRHLKVVISVKSFRRNRDVKLSLMPEQDNFEHDYPILLLSYNTIKDAIIDNHVIKKIRRKRNVYIDEDYEEDTNSIWDDDNQKKTNRKLKRARNNCKRRPLYIDFSEIYYDTWIVQPSGYEAFQCHGKCFFPVAEHLSPTKHAIVQALLHSLAPMKASRSCCVPTKLDAISVLYIDNRGVLTYRYAYKDMVVAECGCR